LPGKSSGRGRPRLYGEKLGNASSLADKYKPLAKMLSVNLYGKVRSVMAYEEIFTIKTLKCQIKVVWVFRKNQWIALFSTDTALSIEKIIEYYGARFH